MINKLSSVLRKALHRQDTPALPIRKLEPLQQVTLKPKPGAQKLGEFVKKSYTNAAGTRAYTVFVPSGYAGKPIPLLIMLHGCTQSTDDFAAGTRMNGLAEEQCFLVAYPAQTRSANVAMCWNWFNGSDQMRGSGEPSLIAGITRQIQQDFAVDARRVYVAGLSAGGAAAAVLGTTYPDVYAAIGVHSGLPSGAAKNLPSALGAMRNGATLASPRELAIVPTIVFHGDTDTTVHPSNGDALIARNDVRALRRTVEDGRVPGGRAYRRIVYADESQVARLEQWIVHGAGHAWSGGSPTGTYTDPLGPDASRAMLSFFRAHELAGGATVSDDDARIGANRQR